VLAANLGEGVNLTVELGDSATIAQSLAVTSQCGRIAFAMTGMHLCSFVSVCQKALLEQPS
jgi:hypothetical protein